MAIVANPTYSIVYTFRDNNGKTSNVSVQVNGSILYTDVLTAAANLAPIMQGVSDAALTGYSLVRSFTEDAPATPGPESEVERKLRVPLNAGVFQNATYIEVPSARFTLEVNGTDIVDLANADIIALRNALVNQGGILGTAQLATYFGEDITGTGEPFVMHRNRKAAK